jgi:ABC-2 type transport system ATP-binding protein
MLQSEKAILAKGLYRAYNGTIAVDGISFAVEPGRIFGFLGPNGAGKTTTIRMLTGQLAPTSGTAYVAGCNFLTQRTALKQRIGVVFEIQNLYERMSGYENLAFFARLYRVEKKRICEVLEQIQLVGREHEAVRRYSNGMKQRLLIARALLHRPQVLFLDEPTRGLDPVMAQQIRAVIVDLKQQGVTIFLTTHYMEEADQLCDHLAIIDRGKIIAHDTPKLLKRQALLNLRCIKLTLHDEQQITLCLDDRKDNKRLCELIEADHVLSIHSQETTLEDIFIRLTGRSLVQ